MKRGNSNEQFEDVASLLIFVTSSQVKTILKVIHTVRSSWRKILQLRNYNLVARACSSWNITKHHMIQNEQLMVNWNVCVSSCIILTSTLTSLIPTWSIASKFNLTFWNLFSPQKCFLDLAFTLIVELTKDKEN